MGLKVILITLGFDVDCLLDICISGPESIQKVNYAHSQGIIHNLILTDLQMPDINGIELTRIFRRMYKNDFNICDRKRQPLIVGVSGHAQSQYEEQGLKAGMDRFESKPLYADSLQEILVQANISI